MLSNPNFNSTYTRPFQWLVSMLALLLSCVTFSVSHANESVPAIAETELQQLSVKLQQHERVRGEFTQQKTVQGMSRPLRSSGQFTYAKTHGLLWTTTQPFMSRLVVTPTAIGEIDDQGQLMLKQTADNPQMAAFMQMFMALVGGDVSQLLDFFVITGDIQANVWQLQLTPKTDELGQFITSAQLQGNEFLQRIQINEANGDQTVIDYQQVNLQGHALTPAEQAEFAPVLQAPATR